MSTNQLNVLVSMMIAIALLMSESRDEQTYPNITTQTPSILARHYCGKALTDILRIVCGSTSLITESYDNRSDQEIKGIDTSQAKAQEMLNQSTAGTRHRRKSQDIYVDCCLNMCTINDLAMYCN